MNKNAVIKGASYILAHGPDFVIHNGTTQTTERIVNPDSDYLSALAGHLRSYEDAVNYPPNQVYIGNLTPGDLSAIEFPWYDKLLDGANRYGKFGEIMPEDEFIGLIKICDVFDLVHLEEAFADDIKTKLADHPLIDSERLQTLEKCKDSRDVIKQLVEEQGAEGLYFNKALVGAIKKAHDIDGNLSAHVMLENLVSKASNVLSLLHLLKVTGIEAAQVDYVIDCCEEAIGDMNQRGGGNLAKAVAEIAGLINATGSDTRSFCAGPSHAIVEAAALVKSGTYKNVIVTAGGSTAKLGMNGKDHVKKGLPILEDAVAGFSVLISENDGISPEFNLNNIGRHKVGTGSSPQAVISSLVTDPLDKAGLKITDIGKFAAEMQNPDVTKPAGAGDVPEANYKMIAALGVKQGTLERSAIGDFVKQHGMTGWAPTQGHIPSGVPYLGFAREDILSGKIDKAMIIGKGSLFLGRMTNLFDGVSVIIQKNSVDEAGDKDFLQPLVKKPIIGLAVQDSELGMEEIHQGIALAERKGFKVLLIDGGDVHKKMESMLESGKIQGAVTMHYSFPIGVSTVGRIITPSKGKELYLATTTGTSSTDRVEGMVKNAIYGIIAAKASGLKAPSVGVANIDGARQVEKALCALKDGGYHIEFAESQRSDGGLVMRGNDLLTASSDVMVMDPLTGNLMMKMLTAYSTGGSYESSGYGYGPGIGEDYDKLVLIVSRASGAPVIAGAIEYASQLVENDWKAIVKDEFARANRAGLKQTLESVRSQSRSTKGDDNKEQQEPLEVGVPEKEIVTAEITGIEVMDIEDAAACLWKESIYAETGMGCTGPVVLVSEANEEKSRVILTKAGYI